MSKFKIGDKLECIDAGEKGFGWELGRVGTVKKISEYANSIYWFNEFRNGVYEDSLKLVDKKLVDKNRKFKVGDVVRLFNKETKIKCIHDNIAFFEEHDSHTIAKRSGAFCEEHEGIMGYHVEKIELVTASPEAKEALDKWGEQAREIVDLGFNNNVDSPTTVKKGRNIMSRVIDYVKDSLLSVDERLLRKYGLKDSCGDYTSEARELAMQKLMQECEDYFVKVAKGLEEENNKNK